MNICSKVSQLPQKAMLCVCVCEQAFTDEALFAVLTKKLGDLLQLVSES